MENISIHTAQNVSIEYQPAGIMRRLVSAAIDYSILLAVIITISMTGYSIKSDYTPWIVIYLIAGAIILFYSLLMELFFKGRSVGKMITHLQVVRLDGRRLSFWDCLLRWTLKLIDINLCMGAIAIISIISTKNMQRIGDLAAGTTVIFIKKPIDLNQFDLYATTDNYQVIFPQASLLGDRDIALIKEVYQKTLSKREYSLLDPLCGKIREITGIQTRMNNMEFIHTILRDHHHLTKM